MDAINYLANGTALVFAFYVAQYLFGAELETLIRKDVA